MDFIVSYVRSLEFEMLVTFLLVATCPKDCKERKQK